MKEYYFGRKRWYDADEVDKVIVEQKAENKQLDDLAHDHDLELLQKENCIAEQKSKLDYYERWLSEWRKLAYKFKDIELEIDK